MKKMNKNHSGSSTIKQHKKLQKRLIPPYLQLQNLHYSSWINDRLPEMLWACLIVYVFPREDALNTFRKIVSYIQQSDNEDCKHWDLEHTSLVFLPDEIFSNVIKMITDHPLGYASLRPLLLLESLPNRERWKAILDVEPTIHDWKTIAHAVSCVLDHQSQAATDVRWLKVLFKIKLGKIQFAPDLSQILDCILDYPNNEDIERIDAEIRAIEISFSTEPKKIISSWSHLFWDECLKKTVCLPEKSSSIESSQLNPQDVFDILSNVHLNLCIHWFDTISTSAVDARHDSVFGFGFYALALLLELIMAQNRNRITGRLILRALAECSISLAYLIVTDKSDLWLKYRNFGTGQAKLSLLKYNEMGADKPAFINDEFLQQFVNEDFHQEYVSIDLGHWCQQDLRKMAELSYTKNDYDKYYGWNSLYSHGHWPAIRGTCFGTCFNPLHRLHRIPLPMYRFMEDSVNDAVYLVNKVLSLVDKAYPKFSDRI